MTIKALDSIEQVKPSASFDIKRFFFERMIAIKKELKTPVDR